VVPSAGLELPSGSGSWDGRWDALRVGSAVDAYGGGSLPKLECA
jgi:hypothetical protein